MGAEPGPEYILPELISGGRAPKSIVNGPNSGPSGYTIGCGKPLLRATVPALQQKTSQLSFQIKVDPARPTGAVIVECVGCARNCRASTVSRYAAPPVIRSCAPLNSSGDHCGVEGQRGGIIGRGVTHSASELHDPAPSAAKFIETSNFYKGLRTQLARGDLSATWAETLRQW